MSSVSPKPDPQLAFKRHQITQSIRQYFIDLDFIETDTPVRLDTPALEDNIDAIESDGKFLRTSPELHMKRLLCAGAQRLFQIGPNFRRGEHGKRHRSEFTMLEWYQIDADYIDLMTFTECLIRSTVQTLHSESAITYQGQTIEISGTFDRVRVNDAFITFAECSAAQALADNAFDEIMVSQIEPALGRLSPTFLFDYPIECAALARPKTEDTQLAERWELYISGLEIANAYSELTDAAIQRDRFDKTIAYRRAHDMPVYDLDHDFLSALDDGMPDSAGCALGLDRLAMILLDKADIADVRLF